MKRQTTKFPGVRFREHPTRKYGIRPDRYFTIRFQRQGKQVEEGLGWASAGWTVERAAAVLGDLKRSNVIGEPVNLREKRAKVQRENLTFGQFALETYFRLAEDNGKKSLNRERSLFKCWIKPVIGDKPLSRVSPLDLERIKKNMATAGRSPRSIHYCLAVIRQTFNQAKKLSLFQGDNPVGKVKKPKVDNRRLRFLTHEEATRLLNELEQQDPQLHDITLLSLHCGLRAGELINLTWDCIDLERKILSIKDTKSGRGRAAFLTVQAASMLAAGGETAARAMFFRAETGKKWWFKTYQALSEKSFKNLALTQG